MRWLQNNWLLLPIFLLSVVFFAVTIWYLHETAAIRHDLQINRNVKIIAHDTELAKRNMALEEQLAQARKEIERGNTEIRRLEYDCEVFEEQIKWYKKRLSAAEKHGF